jgi:hypothetical protein
MTDHLFGARGGTEMTETVVKHFVTFYSPRTFVSETTEKAIDSWDVAQAIEMSRAVLERYDARPYGFRFSTRTRGPNDLDSRVSATSGMYYLGGKVETLAEVKARATNKERILIDNMEGNGWERVITNDTPWRSTHPLEKDDVVLELPATPSTGRAHDGGGQ